MGEPFCTFVLIDGLINLVVEVWNERIRGVDGADGVTLGYEVQGVSGEAW